MQTTGLDVFCSICEGFCVLCASCLKRLLLIFFLLAQHLSFHSATPLILFLVCPLSSSPATFSPVPSRLCRHLLITHSAPSSITSEDSLILHPLTPLVLR